MRTPGKSNLSKRPKANPLYRAAMAFARFVNCHLWHYGIVAMLVDVDRSLRPAAGPVRFGLPYTVRCRGGSPARISFLEKGAEDMKIITVRTLCDGCGKETDDFAIEEWLSRKRHFALCETCVLAGLELRPSRLNDHDRPTGFFVIRKAANAEEVVPYA